METEANDQPLDSDDDAAEIFSLPDLEDQFRRSILRGDAEGAGRLLDLVPELLAISLWPLAIYQAKSLAITRLLLDRGLNPNECSAPRLPLHLAVYQCLPDIVELLIARGADANFRNPLGERPLDLLDAYEPRPLGDSDAARIRRALVAAGAEEDIYTIIRAGQVDRLKELLVADPSLAQADSDLGGPLFVAARSARVEIVRLLFESGADPNKRNGMKNTPLWFAAQSPASPEDRLAVMDLLLRAGAHLAVPGEKGSTALHFAAWRGPASVVQFLLDRGADRLAQDEKGLTALDYAETSTSPDRTELKSLLQK